MSRTKVTTLQDLENTDDELLVNTEHYKQMQLLIRRHQSKINSLLEKEEMDEMQITILNEQLETVANLARELKKQIGETNVSKETLKDSMKKHRANFKNIEDTFKAKPTEQFNSKSKAELLKLVMEKIQPLETRFNDIFN